MTGRHMERQFALQACTLLRLACSDCEGVGVGVGRRRFMHGTSQGLHAEAPLPCQQHPTTALEQVLECWLLVTRTSPSNPR